MAAVRRGTSYGTPTRPEVELAEEIVGRTPVDKVRFVSSGTEATMSAVRLARGFTGRELVVKFAGCYHGHVDSLLASAGSGLATFAVPGTPGVPAASTAATLVLPYNDTAAVEQVFAEHGDKIACLITEASPGNMGVVPPAPGFNAFLSRDLHPPRRAVHQRRGDDRLPGDPLRPVRPRRRGRGLATRPGDVRQGDGRRLPGRGVRRPRRRDEPAVAGGAGLPGRHAVGEPGGDDRRAGHAAARHRRRLRPPRPVRRPPGRRGREGAHRGRRAAPGAARRQHVQRVPLRRRGRRGPRLRDREHPERRALQGVLPRMLDQGVYLPPSAFEAWFLSAAHDDAALDRVVSALPAAARAAAAVPPADPRGDR